MAPKEIKLTDLVVKSFVTKLSDDAQKTIQGGNRGNGGNLGTEVPIFC